MTLAHASLDCWSLLVLKASRALQDAQQQSAQGQARLEQLLASESKIQAMLIDYRRQHLERGADPKLMADDLNHRQFLAQLQQVLDRAVRATSAARRDCERLAQAVLAARRELDKAEKLEAHAREKERRLAGRAEQKRQDDLATMRYQWREA